MIFCMTDTYRFWYFSRQIAFKIRPGANKQNFSADANSEHLGKTSHVRIIIRSSTGSMYMLS